MKVVLFSNLVNFYLNVGLIFGSNGIKEFLDGTIFSFISILWTAFPFPELGVKGAAIGTLVATIVACIHYCIYLFEDDLKTKYQIFRLNINKDMLTKQLIIGYPIALQEVMVMFSFTIFYKIPQSFRIAIVSATPN